MLEYNTQRKPLRIADYGRVVLKMIDYCRQLPTREERNRMVQSILRVMEHLNPKVRERSDYQRILWDHLMVMANFDLDVDCPYQIVREETECFHPHRLQLPQGRIHYRHYGRTLEDMIRSVAEMPEGPQRDELTGLIAHNMKRQYLQWNRDSVEDRLIAQQLYELMATMTTSQSAAMAKRKKKKKKKKI